MTRRDHAIAAVVCALTMMTGTMLWAVPPGATAADQGAAADAAKAIGGYKIPDGHTMALFASEPLLGNPVSICLDEQGRVYVAETYRFSHGVTDDRQEGYWLDDDLATTSVEQRLEVYKKWAAKGKHPMTWFTDHSDQIRLIVDDDGDGKADHSTIFAGDFNDPVSGLGAGVIARRGTVYYTNIPDLWMLRDTDGDGKADVRKSLHRGFGVRTSFLGHDLHGLVWGPDGKLYFSIGDRGYNIKTPEGRHLFDAGRGAVFRCNPDGSDLEVVYRGLRNPQELAFDKYGNLFAGDNNSDAGDAARLVYIVEGGNSGWQMSYQYMGGDYTRGPWHAEKIWHNQNDDQPAWTLPPVRNIGGGPSGLVYYPGVGMDSRYDNHFFLCDFHGSASSSRIESFAVDAKGAGFELVDDHTFLDKILATDVTFGYDGKMYISDWINGWGGTGNGRIYTLINDSHHNDPPVQQTHKLFTAGFDKLGEGELINLLDNPDMRVRLEAQFELVDRAFGDHPTGPAALIKVAKSGTNQLARLHAIWALGTQVDAEPRCTQALLPLLSDSDDEVRAQAAKVLGNAGYANAEDDLGLREGLTRLINDPNPRVRFFAIMSIGKLGPFVFHDAIDPIVNVLRENADADRFLRHACVMGLYGLKDLDAVLKHANDPSRAARMGVLLVLRRAEDARIAKFLTDADPGIVTEAARAIHDVPINAGLPALADLIDRYTNVESAKVEATAATNATGVFKREYFDGLGNRGIDQVIGDPQFDGKPSSTTTGDTFASEHGRADNYASRISGVIEAPADGKYTFYLSADDSARLFLSSDDTPGNKREIARSDTWQTPDKWSQSKPIALEKGKRYYIEAVHAEGAGDDHVAVGWKLPDGKMERPIGSGGSYDAYGRAVSNRKSKGAGGASADAPLLRRILNANLRLGDEEHASKVARYAATASADEAMRLEALGVLGAWAEPAPRDRVMGDWRPQDKRDPAIARKAIEGSLGSLLSSSSGKVEAEVTRLMTQYGVQSDPGAFLARVSDANRPVESRIEALRLLAARKHAKLDDAVKDALNSNEPLLRAEATHVLAGLRPDDAVAEIRKTLAGDSVVGRQHAMEVLGEIGSASADALLVDQVNALKSGKLDAAVRLDALEAAQAHAGESASVKAALDAYTASLPAGDVVAPFSAAMEGGDAARGRVIFDSHVAAQCLRCHTVNGVGGTTGPDLSKVATRAKRDYLLESLINPSAKIAQGFEMVVITTKDGKTVVGTLTSDKGDKLTLSPPAGEPVSVDKSNVASRTSQKISAMPPMGAILKPMELRDVIEYLSSLK
ncbi:MAG: c-type cytochrome [Phycisphaera sp.]|nr:c-type cytochrome [Phycisphaera sp.]